MPSASSGGDAIFAKGLPGDLTKLPKVALAVADSTLCPTIDLVGYHPDGKITPSRYETYKAYVARLNLAGR